MLAVLVGATSRFTPLAHGSRLSLNRWPRVWPRGRHVSDTFTSPAEMLLLAVASGANEPAIDYSLIERVNGNLSLTWTAGHNAFLTGKSLADVRRLCGLLPNQPTQNLYELHTIAFAAFAFDSSTTPSGCRVIRWLPTKVGKSASVSPANATARHSAATLTPNRSLRFDETSAS